MRIISKIKNLSIILKEKINKNDYDEIKKLEEICIARDDISFKLEIEYKLNNLKQSDGIVNINDFMLYDDCNLLGYIGISDFGGDTLEVNGMVHPDYRNKGIFTRLFLLVRDEWNKRKQKEMLLLSDNKSLLGLKFIKKISQSYDHSEYDMILNNQAITDSKQNTINLRKAIMSDSTVIAKMDSIFFDMDVKEEDEYVQENIKNETTYIAEINNMNIGKVRLELSDRVGGIYGLGVFPEHRGKGYGRELLTLSIDKLKQMDAHKIMLQVEINNKNALNLYKSCGFEENYVMEYYKMSKEQEIKWNKIKIQR